MGGSGGCHSPEPGIGDSGKCQSRIGQTVIACADLSISYIIELMQHFF